MGHPCGIGFKAAHHMAAHPDLRWQSAILHDLESHPWTDFKVAP